MKTLELIQGSAAWHAHRAITFGASEAPVMKGVSKHMKRNELLRQRALGTEQEVSDFLEKHVYSRGHAAEAAARPQIEALIGEELYPAVGVSEEHPHLSASFDGITMGEDTLMECKLRNADLAAQVEAGEITDPAYYWQLEQQLLVSGAERAIFVICNDDGTQLSHCEYRPVPGRAKELLAGWAQFQEDLANYQHVEEAPAAVGRALMSLPTLTVELIGEVKSSNLVLYRANALDFIESINTDLKTDQDFADAETAVKKCEEVESNLATVKRIALSQTKTIEELFATIDELSEAMRQKRMTLDKLVKARKEVIRAEIKAEAEQKLRDHVATINKRFAGRVTVQMPVVQFAEAMKNKRTLSSIRDGVDTLLANTKISINEVAERYSQNLARYDELMAGKSFPVFLFTDLQTLVSKDPDGFEAIVKQRISEHEAAEQRRLDAERERIRAEEEARALQTVTTAASSAPSANTSQAAPTAAAAPAHRTASVTTAAHSPSHRSIVEHLANHYQTDELRVIRWLSGMDFNALRQHYNKETV
jgi:putative phage-type endonuclease